MRLRLGHPVVHPLCQVGFGMSDTPRTDKLLLDLYGTERVEAEKIVNEFCRQLERELRKCAAAHMLKNAAAVYPEKM